MSTTAVTDPQVPIYTPISKVKVSIGDGPHDAIAPFASMWDSEPQSG